jgi:Gpi18-like mannosyltransferase
MRKLFALIAKVRTIRETLSDMVRNVSNSYLRFIVSTATVLTWKLATIAYLFFRLSGKWLQFNPLSVLIGWDTYSYVDIAESGYHNLRLFAYFPVYPSIIRVFYLATHDPVLSASLPAFVFGFAFVPLFQMAAERYMDRQSAIKCAIVVAFFPVVFVFTSLAYADSILLFLSLQFWIEYKALRFGRASFVLAVASLTKPLGAVLGVPLLIEIVAKRQFKSIAYLALPFFSMMAWLYYGYYSTGDWFVFRRAELSYWSQADWLRSSLLPFLKGQAFNFQSVSFFIIIIVGFLVYLTFQEDWRLGVFSLGTYASIILFAGPPELSYLRYFSFIFPIWFLGRRVRSWSLLLIYCIFMSLSSMMLWYQFATGVFVG